MNDGRLHDGGLHHGCRFDCWGGCADGGVAGDDIHGHRFVGDLVDAALSLFDAGHQQLHDYRVEGRMLLHERCDHVGGGLGVDVDPQLGRFQAGQSSELVVQPVEVVVGDAGGFGCGLEFAPERVHQFAGLVRSQTRGDERRLPGGYRIRRGEERGGVAAAGLGLQVEDGGHVLDLLACFGFLFGEFGGLFGEFLVLELEVAPLVAFGEGQHGADLADGFVGDGFERSKPVLFDCDVERLTGFGFDEAFADQRPQLLHAGRVAEDVAVGHPAQVAVEAGHLGAHVPQRLDGLVECVAEPGDGVQRPQLCVQGAAHREVHGPLRRHSVTHR